MKLMRSYCMTKALRTYQLFSVGRPKHVRIMAGALEGEYFIGPKAEVLWPHASSVSLQFQVRWRDSCTCNNCVTRETGTSWIALYTLSNGARHNYWLEWNGAHLAISLFERSTADFCWWSTYCLWRQATVVYFKVWFVLFQWNVKVTLFR